MGKKGTSTVFSIFSLLDGKIIKDKIFTGENINSWS
jgi:hypothetical protein